MQNAARDDTAPVGITPEIMAVIDAAVTAYVGHKANILSVRLGVAMDTQQNSWAGQGRNVLYQSHNLVQRGH